MINKKLLMATMTLCNTPTTLGGKPKKFGGSKNELLGILNCCEINIDESIEPANGIKRLAPLWQSLGALSFESETDFLKLKEFNEAVLLTGDREQDEAKQLIKFYKLAGYDWDEETLQFKGAKK